LGVWGFGGDFGFSARGFVGRECSGEGVIWKWRKGNMSNKIIQAI